MQILLDQPLNYAHGYIIAKDCAINRVPYNFRANFAEFYETAKVFFANIMFRHVGGCVRIIICEV